MLEESGLAAGEQLPSPNLNPIDLHEDVDVTLADSRTISAEDAETSSISSLSGVEPSDDDGQSTLMAEELPSSNGEKEEVKSRGLNGDAREATTGASRHRGSFRGTSAKIANLRAAFEKSGPNEGGVKRGYPSSERKPDQGVERDKEREREYWKEIARLRDERDKENELRQALEDRCTVLEEQVESLQERLEQQRSNGAAQANDLHVQQGKMDEVSNLQQQLSDLKRSISTSTRMDSQMSDSTFAQGMGVLHHELQNWVVNNYRRAKTEATPEELCARLEAVVDSTPHISIMKQIYATFDSTAKLAILQATAVLLIVEIFTAPILFGLSMKYKWCESLVQTFEDMQLTLSATAFNKWRATTIEAIQESEDLQRSVQKASQAVIGGICHCLCRVTNIELSESGKTSLKSITKRAVSLAHLFRMQRARYDFHLPSPGDAFDPAVMEDASGSGEAQIEVAVRCATFPAVIKLGDEYGDNLHLRNVIVKAKVLCDPEP